LCRGANGLTLVEANHVFLVEPVLHPGVEIQAIFRIYRVGQQRATTVHRFVVDGTVEVAMRSVLPSLVQERQPGARDRHKDMGAFTLQQLGQLLNLPTLGQTAPAVPVSGAEAVAAETMPPEAQAGAGASRVAEASAAADLEQPLTWEEQQRFWCGQVLHNGKTCTREAAVCRLQMQLAAQARSASCALSGRRVPHYGKVLEVEVIEALQQLEPLPAAP
jgi:hypothetical protein